MRSYIPKCGRCAQEIEPGDAERCWFCGDDLCLGCWEAVGHCGHEIAEQVNELARRGPVAAAVLDEVLLKHGRDPVVFPCQCATLPSKKY